MTAILCTHDTCTCAGLAGEEIRNCYMYTFAGALICTLPSFFSALNETLGTGAADTRTAWRQRNTCVRIHVYVATHQQIGHNVQKRENILFLQHHNSGTTMSPEIILKGP